MEKRAAKIKINIHKIRHLANNRNRICFKNFKTDSAFILPLIARILHHLRVITYLIYRNRHQIIRRSTEFTNVTCHLCILEEVLIFGSFHI